MPTITRRTALTTAAVTPLAAVAADPPKKVRVGVIGCGSVSHKYLPHLAACPFAELVSVCDRIPDRAAQAAKRWKVPAHYPHIDAMFAGEHFDLFVDLTDMQEHEALNRKALDFGKHVWSEKPIANSLTAGQGLLRLAKSKGIRLWGAPTPVASPQFTAMAKLLGEGAIGRVAAATASYGWTGPDWASFFYEPGGGSLPDLGVYNLTSLTGLLGPARSVTAMVSVVTPTRRIQGKGEVKVAAEDNAQVLLDHGNGVISHMQCGFNYFTPHEHDFAGMTHHSLTVIGSGGTLALVGYDWAPQAVDLGTPKTGGKLRRLADGKSDYVWQNGASLAAECLATGKEPLVTPEHALHVLEVMQAAVESQRNGRRVAMKSTFKWPVVN